MPGKWGAEVVMDECRESHFRLMPKPNDPDAGAVSASMPPPGYVPPPSGGGPTSIPRASATVPARSRPPGPRRLIGAGLGLAAAVAAVLVLFGSASSQVTDPIAQAATVSSNAPGYRMNLSLTMTSPAFSAPILASGSAVVDPRDHAVSMSIAFDFSQLPQVAQSLGSTTMQMRMLLDGQVMYMKLPQTILNAAPTLAGKPWIKVNLAKVTGIPGLSSLGNDPTTNDPSQMLQYLRAASDGVTAEGQQQVDGVQTTHYLAQLSLDRLPGGLPPADQAAIQQALSKLRQATQSQDLPVEVWIDAHHLVRRMAMSIALNPPTGPALQETATADMSDYGPQPRPTPPPADQVKDLSSLASLSG